MSFRQRLAKSAFWATAATWGREAIAFFIFLLLARILGPEVYGLVGMALVVIFFTEVFLQDSVGQAIIQRRDLEREHIDAAFWALMSIAVVLTVAVWFAAPPIAAFFGEPTVIELLRTLSAVIVLQALTAVPTALIQRDLRFRVLALRSWSSILVGGGIGVGLALTGYGVWALVGQQVGLRLVACIVLWSATPWRPRFAFSWEHFGHIRKFSADTIAVRLIQFVVQYMPRVIIGRAMGPLALGYFTAAQRVTRILQQLIVTPIGMVAMPAFSKLQDDPARLKRAMVTGTQLSALIAFPSFLGLTVVAPDVVPLAMGPRWLDSVPLMQLLSLAGIPFCITMFSNNALRALGHTGAILHLNIVTVILILIILAVATPYGLIVLAASLVGRGYLMSPVIMYVEHRLTGVSVWERIRAVLPMAAAAVIMAVTVEAWRRTAAAGMAVELRLLTSVLLGVLVYGLATYTFRRAVIFEVVDLMRAMLKRSPAA